MIDKKGHFRLLEKLALRMIREASEGNTHMEEMLQKEMKFLYEQYLLRNDTSEEEVSHLKKYTNGAL